MKGNIPFYRLLIQPFAELDRVTGVAEYRTTARVKPDVYLFEFGRTSLGRCKGRNRHAVPFAGYKAFRVHTGFYSSDAAGS